MNIFWQAKISREGTFAPCLLLLRRTCTQVSTWGAKTCTVHVVRIMTRRTQSLYRDCKTAEQLNDFGLMQHASTLVVKLKYNKCTKHQFIHLLTATFKDLHIENSKNYKRWYYSAAHWHTVSVMQAISPFVIFAVFDVQVPKCCR